MQRSALAVVAALLMMVLSACGADDDAPTVSNKAPFIGEKFTISGTVDGARSVMLQAYDDEGWDDEAEAETTSDGEYSFTTAQDEPVVRYGVVAAATDELD